jgi:hypothetical protein
MSANGWKNIISDKETSELCTPHDVFVLRLKARCLAATLSHALILYESTVDFLEICKLGIQTINEIDGCVCDENDEHDKIMQIYNPRTIMECLHIFRRTSSFPNPAVVHQCHWKNKLPAIFQNNPDLHQSLISYARSNLATLSCELIHQYLFSTAIPGIVARVQKETGQEYNAAQFLKDNNLTTLSLSTVYGWLGLLGFIYSLSRKSYYIDSHEEGWVGKAKGSLQILYERGWIDPEQWWRYTDKGQLDEMGILMECTSLHLLMQKQSDFATELTLLQFYGSKMGATVDRTPKCHPELAREGIEYIWAMAKLYYRHQLLTWK